MRNFVSILIFCVCFFAYAGCSDDSGLANTNSSANAIVSQGDANAAAVPNAVFTDAGLALAEGNKLLDANRTEEALHVLTQAVNLDPELAEAHFKLGIAYALIEKRDDAVVDVEAIPTPSPKGKKRQEEKTNSEKSFERAVAAYKKTIAKNRGDDVAHFNLGRAYNKLNEDEDAAKSLREAVKLKPDETEYQTELGAILFKLAKYAESVAALKKAVELDPSNSQAEELLADAQAGQKRVGFSTAKKDDKKAQKPAGNANTNSTLPDLNANKISTVPGVRKPIPAPTRP